MKLVDMAVTPPDDWLGFHPLDAMSFHFVKSTLKSDEPFLLVEPVIPCILFHIPSKKLTSYTVCSGIFGG